MNSTRKKLAISAFVAVLVLTALLTGSASSQTARQIIRIKSDGTVDPTSAPIQRNGDMYTFTGDVYGEIKVEKGGIVIDGAGHSLMGSYNGTQSLWIIGEGPNQPLTNDTELWSIGIDVVADNIGDMTIRNLGIKNFSIGMFLWSSNNKVTETSISDGIVGILVSGSNNTIKGNLISNNKNGVFFGASKGTIPLNIMVSDNRFVNNLRQLGGCVCIDYNTTETVHTWDDGKRGNFWSDYNGTDSNGDGIGDTPYVIDVLNQDRYPLMQGSVTPPNSPIDIHVEIAILAAALTIVAVVAVVAFKRRRKRETPDTM